MVLYSLDVFRAFGFVALSRACQKQWVRVRVLLSHAKRPSVGIVITCSRGIYMFATELVQHNSSLLDVLAALRNYDLVFFCLKPCPSLETNSLEGILRQRLPWTWAGLHDAQSFLHSSCFSSSTLHRRSSSRVLLTLGLFPNKHMLAVSCRNDPMVCD